MIEIWLIRHAESINNRYNSHLIGGRANDVGLTDTGVEQSKKLGDYLKNVEYDIVFSSTACRTMETGYFAGLNINTENSYNDLLELNQGDWEEQKRDEIYTDEILNEIKANNWHFKAPNGESQYEVEKRMVDWITKNILEKYTSGRFLILSHGMAIACFLRYIRNTDPRETYKHGLLNTSITKVRYENNTFYVDDFNNINHL